MKRIYLIYICMLIPLCLNAQKEIRAKDILQKAEQTLEKSSGIIAEFQGDINGSISLKGEKFHLQANGTECWYDGKTLWSYTDKTEEVNISLPTDEELQAINPYRWIKAYKENYDYKLSETKTKNGIKGYEIILTPEEKQSITSINMFLSEKYIPIYIKVWQGKNQAYEINISKYNLSQPIADTQFVFDKKKYPEAEVIDLR